MTYTTVGYDLDPTGGSGDYTVRQGVDTTESLVIALNTTTATSASVSVDWVNEDGDVFTTESKTDISMDSVSDDWCRLVSKGPAADVTVTSEETNGTTNTVNVFVDTQGGGE